MCGTITLARSKLGQSIDKKQGQKALMLSTVQSWTNGQAVHDALAAHTAAEKAKVEETENDNAEVSDKDGGVHAEDSAGEDTPMEPGDDSSALASSHVKPFGEGPRVTRDRNKTLYTNQ